MGNEVTLKKIRFTAAKDIQVFDKGRWVTAFEYGKKYLGHKFSNGKITAYSPNLMQTVEVKDTGMIVIKWQAHQSKKVGVEA